MKAKISITLRPELYEPIQKEANSRGISLSGLIEEALEFWQQHRLEKDLKEYYQEMSAFHAERALEEEILLPEVWSEGK
ncbi:MAG: ribbon-helix-helix protein, CopG family [Candidatus Tectomicrobia bacterium]|uniref:Ribbon-helix-helix protein, CopG family n=1 Tax=Tectimicrobiota bacterium TaxID=2528274 RepID=A0A933LQW2_UNCTE|nr:ribbon-helix-helix protein, CopG family [Candidatus Tectomicrobia bacterium]